MSVEQKTLPLDTNDYEDKLSISNQRETSVREAKKSILTKNLEKDEPQNDYDRAVSQVRAYAEEKGLELTEEDVTKYAHEHLNGTLSTPMPTSKKVNGTPSLEAVQEANEQKVYN